MDPIKQDHERREALAVVRLLRLFRERPYILDHLSTECIEQIEREVDPEGWANMLRVVGESVPKAGEKPKGAIVMGEV
jgi:hypothetical protein